MMIGQGNISARAHGRAVAGRHLAGADLPTLQTLRAKYGDGPHSGIEEISEIMSTLVYPVFTDKDWQYCTINQWLNGAPSEDDLSLVEEYMSGMPTLETWCGDHSYFDQYKAAFEDFENRGAPKEVIDWLRKKGEFNKQKKLVIAQQEGEKNLKKATEETGRKLNPFENPLVVTGVAMAIALIIFLRIKK